VPEQILPVYQQKKGDSQIVESDAAIKVLVKFKVRGILRFLSHAEMLRLFQRACMRAGIKLQHSEGFNPRPKLSLPLPKPVGVEVDDDLLCLFLDASTAAFDPERFKEALSAQLPRHCQVLAVTTAKQKAAPQPREASYLLPLSQEHLNKKLKTRIGRLMASDSLNLDRHLNAKRSSFKNVDVRPFIKSIAFDNEGIVIECKTSSAGSVRVDEILDLLELDEQKLAAPVRRTSVEWQ
jgi:radical SAM-linked protein